RKDGPVSGPVDGRNAEAVQSDQAEVARPEQRGVDVREKGVASRDRGPRLQVTQRGGIGGEGVVQRLTLAAIVLAADLDVVEPAAEVAPRAGLAEPGVGRAVGNPPARSGDA